MRAVFLVPVVALMVGCHTDAGLAPNKPLVTNIYTADPAAHVFDDQLYIYTSHDIDTAIPPDDIGSQYDMKDYHVFSIADFNSTVVDHGAILEAQERPLGEQAALGSGRGLQEWDLLPLFPGEGQGRNLSHRRRNKPQTGRRVHGAARAHQRELQH